VPVIVFLSLGAVLDAMSSSRLEVKLVNWLV